jgi:hypothetical protein
MDSLKLKFTNPFEEASRIGRLFMNFLYIRDVIIINATLQERIDEQPLIPGSKVILLARQIRHDPGFTLKLKVPGCSVIIAAQEYDGAGGGIDVSGGGGPAGAQGTKGSKGKDPRSDGTGGSAGGPGGIGGPGGRGADATRVRVTCEILRSARLIARGGDGGSGGVGGTGGSGGDGRIIGRERDTIDGTRGGDGGVGGVGGNGGTGGQVNVTYIIADTVPMIDVSGGAGGVGGIGGRGGNRGALADDNGRPGLRGVPGVAGAAGQIFNAQVSVNDYWTFLLAELDSDTVLEWANYRLLVGAYFYRAYNLLVPGRNGYLVQAMQEFDAVLRLDSSNTQAATFQEQILLGKNILGLANDLDLIPEFNLYIDKFVNFTNVLFGRYSTSVNFLLISKVTAVLRDQLVIQRDLISNDIADAQNDLDTALIEQRQVDKDIEDAQSRLNDINNKIQAALEEMRNQSFSFGDVLGTVFQVGTAVVSVIAAVPTGGASLLALVPSVVALANTAVENIGPIVDTLFKEEAPERKKVVDEYMKVNKNIDNVVKAGRSVINLVSLIDKLASGKTPDNSKYVALIQQGVELAHSLLLAGRRKELADSRVKSEQDRLNRGQALLAKTEDLIGRVSTDERTLREIGIAGIRNAQSFLDVLFEVVFRAVRSVEIYTRKSVSQNLLLDAGFVNPDIDRDYEEGYLDDSNLLKIYDNSWGLLLQPLKMQSEYLSYFNGNNFNQDSQRLSFTDPDVLQNFRDTRSFQFLIDLSDLPDSDFDAKIQDVVVAFVGATSQSGVISCDVRHGKRYLQKQTSGEEDVQLLEAVSVRRPARTTHLELGGVTFDPGLPLDAPRGIALWGRGVAGLWTVSIPQSAGNVDPFDLAGLSEVQVWVGYQFRGV